MILELQANFINPSQAQYISSVLQMNLQHTFMCKKHSLPKHSNSIRARICRKGILNSKRILKWHNIKTWRGREPSHINQQQILPASHHTVSFDCSSEQSRRWELSPDVSAKTLRGKKIEQQAVWNSCFFFSRQDSFKKDWKQGQSFPSIHVFFQFWLGLSWDDFWPLCINFHEMVQCYVWLMHWTKIGKNFTCILE